MEIKEGRIKIQTVEDGRVVADAVSLGKTDNLGRHYGNIQREQLPIETGRIVTAAVLDGLRAVIASGQSHGSLNPDTAQDYLDILGVNSHTFTSIHYIS